MKEQLIQEIQRKMLPYLNNEQLLQLGSALAEALQGVSISQEGTDAKQDEQDAVDAFISAKRIEGCSEKTLKYYRKTIESMLSAIAKKASQITTDDLRKYLTTYQTQRRSSKVTIDNIRRILSSFFSWLEDEDFILKSPVRRIHKVKTAKVVKDTYTDEALELMRDSCATTRDLAIIDLLASSGMRVGEMVMLNREDIDFNERECVVIGKGNKERLVYFDARTKIHLQNYLNERTDTNPALFVSLKAPHDRLMIGGVEARLRELGKRLSLPKVHPHKFRRTLATSAIDKGMPIEQVQQLLGHQKIDTTMHYAMVSDRGANMELKEYRFDEVTINFDKKRVPLSGAQREKRQGNFRYYGAQGVIDHIDDFIFDGTYLLIAEDGENLKSKKQNIAQVVEGQFWVNNHAHIVQGNELCNTRYLCYLLNSMDLSGYVTGSAQPKLSQANLNAVTLFLPSITVQERIVECLYLFDKKIAVNQKINDNLAA